MSLDEMEWQYIGDDTWNFGPKVRGLVRKVADVYFTEGVGEKDYGWRWQTYVGDGSGGLELSLESAVEQVEIQVSKAIGSKK